MRTRRALVVALSASALALSLGLGAYEFLGFEGPRVLAVGPSSCVSLLGFPGSLKGWWPGDRDSRDIIGTNPLVLAVGAGFTGGKVSDGFLLDGVDDHGDAGSTEDLASRVFTIVAWVRTTATRAQTIVERGAGGDSARINYRLSLTSTGRVRFAVGDGTIDHQVLGTSSLNDGAFHLVAAVLAADFPGRPMQLIVDGALEADSAFPGGVPFTTSPQRMLVGAADGSSLNGVQVSDPFSGVIDELVFWGFPLSVVEIQALFDAGEAGICKGLPGYRTGFPISFDLGLDGASSYSEAEIQVARPDAAPLNFQSFGGSVELVNRGGETAIRFEHGGHPFTVMRINSARGGGSGVATFTSSAGASQTVNLASPFIAPLVMAIPDPCCGWSNITSFQWQVPSSGASMAIDDLVVQLPDVDGDRIEDAIDTDPLAFSDDFSDVATDAGGTTTGSVVTRGDQILSITEGPGSGIIIRTDPSGGPIPARVRVCSGGTVYRFSAGENQVFSSCSSVTTEVVKGNVELEMISEEGTVATATLSEPNTLTFDPGNFTFTAPASNSEPIVVFVRGVPFQVVGGESLLIARIDIKPGSNPNPINPNSGGKIPVAILSFTGFDAPAEVKTTSLTFGRTGVEPSLAFCNSSAEDVNADGLPDLKCHFKTQPAGFQPGDGQGFLQGQTKNGVPIKGTDTVRIVNQ